MKHRKWKTTLNNILYVSLDDAQQAPLFTMNGLEHQRRILGQNLRKFQSIRHCQNHIVVANFRVPTCLISFSIPNQITSFYRYLAFRSISTLQQSCNILFCRAKKILILFSTLVYHQNLAKAMQFVCVCKSRIYLKFEIWLALNEML